MSRAVWLLAAAKVVFHLATSGLYGLHRDEFYYLAGGRRLAWGYVDHPPLTPLLFRAQEALFGAGQTGLRVVPALLGGLLVLLGGLLARELGGGRRAQLLTALVAALGPLYLTTSHFLGTVSPELVAWAAASWLLLRLVRTGDPRWWVAIGAVLGLGLLDKYTTVLWAVGAGVGLLATPQRKFLASPWLAAGVAVTTAIVLPNLLWQADHDWAFLEFSRGLTERTAGESRALFVPLQLGIVTLAGTIVWVVALRAGLRRAEPWRWLAIAYAVLAVLLLAVGGKPYYLGPLYLPLVAAGAAVVERTWSPTGQRRLVAAVVVTGALSAPLFTPIVPERALDDVALHDVNPELGGFLGWRRAAEQVAAVHRSLPAAERSDAVVLGQTYSYAGMVEYWQDELGLPPAVSGHNSYWWWGHAPAVDGATTIVVGYDRPFLDRRFGRVERVASLAGADAVADEELRGVTIWICRDQRRPWAELWPDLRRYG